MNKLSGKTLRIIRNVILIASMAATFLAWLTMPAVFRNTRTYHVGNTTWGNKYYLLLIIPFPLLSLLIPMDKSEISELHGDDEEYKAQLKERALRNQMLTQIGTILFYTVFMIFAMFIVKE